MFRIVRFLLLVLLVIAAGYLAYRSLHTVKEKAPENTSYTILQGVFGERKTFRLDDSSTVILNSAGRLKVPRTSGATGRRVILEGDAFFEVTSDAALPFAITTPVLKVSVGEPGASFRFRAPAGAAGESLELLHGRLKVEKAYPSDYPEPEILQAGDMILINRDIDLMEKEEFDTTALVDWKNGRLVLKQASFTGVIRQLEDWYAVNIEVSGAPQSEADISGVFVGKSLRELLDILGADIKFRYHIRDNKVEIIF